MTGGKVDTDNLLCWALGAGLSVDDLDKLSLGMLVDYLLVRTDNAAGSNVRMATDADLAAF